MKSKAEEFLFVSDDNSDYIQEPKVIFRSGIAQKPQVQPEAEMDGHVGEKRTIAPTIFYESPICSSFATASVQKI